MEALYESLVRCQAPVPGGRVGSALTVPFYGGTSGKVLGIRSAGVPTSFHGILVIDLRRYFRRGISGFDLRRYFLHISILVSAPTIHCLSRLSNQYINQRREAGGAFTRDGVKRSSPRLLSIQFGNPRYVM